MNRIALSLIGTLVALSPLAASAAPIKVLDYEAKTGLSSAWERPENRKLIEDRLTLNHTNMQNNEFYANAFEQNKLEITKYSSAFKCASKQDTSKCLPAKKK